MNGKCAGSCAHLFHIMHGLCTFLFSRRKQHYDHDYARTCWIMHGIMYAPFTNQNIMYAPKTEAFYYARDYARDLGTLVHRNTASHHAHAHHAQHNKRVNMQRQAYNGYLSAQLEVLRVSAHALERWILAFIRV